MQGLWTERKMIAFDVSDENGLIDVFTRVAPASWAIGVIATKQSINFSCIVRAI
jgi:hypothetical protein